MVFLVVGGLLLTAFGALFAAGLAFGFLPESVTRYTNAFYQKNKPLTFGSTGAPGSRTKTPTSPATRARAAALREKERRTADPTNTKR